MRKTEDAIGFVREIVRLALWNIAYHEHQLPFAVAELNYAKALVERANIDVNAVRADEGEEDEPLSRNVQQFALTFYDEKQSSVEHHESLLEQAYMNVGFARTLLLRGKYTEIDIKEVQKQVDEERRGWEEKEKA